jgi:hypothetical protein
MSLTYDWGLLPTILTHNTHCIVVGNFQWHRE